MQTISGLRKTPINWTKVTKCVYIRIQSPTRLGLTSPLVFIQHEIQIKLRYFSRCGILWIVKIISFGGYVYIKNGSVGSTLCWC